MTKREQLYVSDEFYDEMEKLILQYKLGKIQVPEKFKGKRVSKNLIYLIELDEYFSKKHNFKSNPLED